MEAALPERVEIAKAAWVAGLLHDVGKYRDGFIRYLQSQQVPGVERFHKEAGAAWAETLRLEPLVSAILGHHGGMLDRSKQEDSLDGPAGRKALDSIRDRALSDCPALVVLGSGPASAFNALNDLDLEFVTRLVFSCLVDADWTDTGCHERAAKGLPLDPVPPAFVAEEWLSTLLAHLAEKRKDSRGGPVADVRKEVLEHALEAAARPAGFFTLTVPTGGGKTLSGLAFALAHARTHGLRRIIYVVPYLSILEQNAAAIRAAVGLSRDDPIVFEHHSLADVGTPSKGAEETRLDDPSRRAENWDAPIIITTNVMFLESLFSNQPRRCRKLHNIARSVIILDECQNLAPALLSPTCAMLKQLVKILGCSVVFSTATQPTLNHRKLNSDAITDAREIVPSSLNLFNRLDRVRVEWPMRGAPLDWTAIASRMCSQKSALCIVNSRRAARELFEQVKHVEPEGCFHLSTSMCPRHRWEILAELRRRLGNGVACRLISTQLIEAGVDVDFPLVFREMAPLDSIIQAAGRCNREGKLPPPGGHVIVFRSMAAAANDRRYYPNDLWYKAGRSVLETRLDSSKPPPDISDPASIEDYFERIYNTGNLDERGLRGCRKDSRFRTVDESYRLIDDVGLSAVLPTWTEHALEIEDLIAAFEPTRVGFRSLSPFQVNMRCDPRQPPTGTVEEKPGLFVWRGRYDADIGWTDEAVDEHWVV